MKKSLFILFVIFVGLWTFGNSTIFFKAKNISKNAITDSANIYEIPAPNFKKRTTGKTSRGFAKKKSRHSSKNNKVASQKTTFQEREGFSSGQEKNPSTTDKKPSETSSSLADRNYSDKEKRALAADLIRRQSLESPFEIGEEVGALKSYLNESDPSKKDSLRRFITSYPKKKNATTGSPTRITPRRIQGEQPVGQDRGTTKPTRDDMGEEFSEDLKYGKVVEDRIRYQERPTELPAHLQTVYDHIRVYEVNAGPGAHVDLGAFSDHQKYPTPLYDSLPNVGKDTLDDSNKKNEQKYRFPPDWSNYFEAEKEEAAVLSQKLMFNLGKNGNITLELINGGKIVNKDGPDFVIWGNPICSLKKSENMSGIKKELKDVLLGYEPFLPTIKQSLDENVVCHSKTARVTVIVEGPNGPTKKTFPCRKGDRSSSSRCAGHGYNAWKPGSSGLDVRKSGGDQYNLEEVGLEEVRAIQITDMGNPGTHGQAGFPLDAFAIVPGHFEKE